VDRKVSNPIRKGNTQIGIRISKTSRRGISDLIVNQLKPKRYEEWK
jgi:hypothetical protein